MAYDFVPTKASEIYTHKKLKTNIPIAGDFVNLFDYLREKDSKIEDPISIDVEKKAAKILPAFEKKVNISSIKAKLKLKIKIDFGRGSRGITNLSKDKPVAGKTKDDGGGTGNKGIIFERDFTKALNDHFKGNKVTNTKFAKCIESIVKDYKLQNKDVQIIPEGELNKRRPIVFQGQNIYVGGSNFNIGSTVTDITLKTMDDKKKTDHVYLSLKYGPKVTFFNAGVAKILSKTELEQGIIKNEQGKLMLALFGIKPSIFASVFDPKQKTSIIGAVDTFSEIDKTLLKNLIKSGVGHGYHLVHMAANGSIHDVEMTQSALDKNCTPQSCKIFYGGATGAAKRVDIYVETPMFSLQFNFRNKSRGGVFPSHLMCDYKIKH